jgi:glycosyltransferase involved in cell wall biosynthesis
VGLTSPGLVSIITPAFNSEAHLPATIESCLDQTYRDFELLIVDDGSTDGTAAVATRYARADSRVRVFRTPNRGMSAARNLAIENASGAFLTFLDSDDMWMPEFLATQIATLNSQPWIDVVTTNTINIGNHRHGTPYWPPSADIRQISLLEMIVREDAVHILSVVRRSVVDRVGGFDPSFRGNEDYHFWLRAAAAGCRFAADFTPRGYYRRRQDSVSSDERRMLAGIMRVLRELRPRCGSGSPEVRAIDAQLRRFERALLVADARECITRGDSVGAVAFLTQIPPADRGPGLSAMLKVAGLWPPLLSFGYRAKRAVRNVGTRFARRTPAAAAHS